MTNVVKTKENLKDTLYNVRKGFRLLKEYQERILEIVYYIKEKYKMPLVQGQRGFCDPLHHRRDGYIRLHRDMWCWDFLYNYEFQYHLGEETQEDDKTYSVCIIQISDTGFYENKDSNPNDLNTFKSVKESESVFVFLFEVIEDDKDWIWDEKFEDAIKYVVNEDDKFQIDEKYLAIKYPIEDFLDQESTDMILADFDMEVEQMTGIKLLKK